MVRRTVLRQIEPDVKRAQVFPSTLENGANSYDRHSGTPRSDGLEMTMELGTSFRVPAARFASELCVFRVPQNSEGAGNAGRWPHPQACVLKGVECTQDSQVGRNDPALPAQWLYGLLRALPGVPGFLAPIAAQSLARLDPSIGGSGPHGLTVRDRTARLAARARPSQPAPRIVTIAKRPSCGRDGFVKS
jgi:hypothetical protein